MAEKTKQNSSEEVRAFLEKIVVNAGIGRMSQQPHFEEKALIQVSKDIAAITGQKPETRGARKSIAGFKIREGQIVGLRVTLRRERMVDFFERLIRIVLPRVRDFGGLDIRTVDKNGNLHIGIKEQFVFPEINPEHSPLLFSLGITLVPRGRNREEALRSYHKFGVPLKGFVQKSELKSK